MTIEIIVGDKKYRIAPDDPLRVEVQHKAGGRWVFWLRRDTVNETKAALLALGRGEE